MDLAARTHRRLLGLVGVLVVVTLAGIVALLPRGDELPSFGSPPEELISGEVLAVDRYEGEPDPITGSSGEMAVITVEILDGERRGETVEIDTPIDGYPPIDPGDEVKLSMSPDGSGGDRFFIVDFERMSALVWLLALFVVAVLAIGGWHGLRSLVGLGISLVIITKFVVPSILSGSSPFAVALFGGLGIMIVTLYLSHGLNEMTTAAVIGTAVALGITIGLGLVFIEAGELTGFASEEATIARFAVQGLDLRGLVLAGLIIAALGVLDDVTVTQASTVFALHDADRSQPWRTLFTRAMSVGRDHIASTVNTLFLAYAGASIALLVVFALGGLPVTEIVESEVFAEEVVKTLVGSLGLIAAVPFTTALAATMAVRRRVDAPPLRGHLHGGVPTATAGGEPPRRTHPAPFADPDEEDLTDEERADRSWIRFLQEGTQGGEVPELDRGPSDRPHDG